MEGNITEKGLIQAIKETAKGWLYDSKDFSCYMDTNSGSCNDFASAVKERLGNNEKCKIVFVGDFLENNGVESYGTEGYSYHVWINFEGKHYDIERINGVDDWRDLPYFKREDKLKELGIYDTELYKLIEKDQEKYKDCICDNYV